MVVEKSRSTNAAPALQKLLLRFGSTYTVNDALVDSSLDIRRVSLDSWVRNRPELTPSISIPHVSYAEKYAFLSSSVLF